jgi:LacI family fructose operon transcriptional repressor
MKLEDIARLAGVSKATVSSVLNGRGEKYRISVVTQARIRGIALEHNGVLGTFRPNVTLIATAQLS